MSIASNSSNGAIESPRSSVSQITGTDSARLLSIYNSYRSTLAILIISLGVASATGMVSLQGYTAGLFALATIWLISALILSQQITAISHQPDLGPLGVMLFDLVITAFLVRLGHDLGPGLPLLYLVTVAASAVVIPNRVIATAVAAIATLAVLSDSAYQLQQGLIDENGMLSAGLLGALIFLISLLLQFIVAKLAKVERLADVATTQVATLEELNEQVIAHMTTGVCRISAEGYLTPVNDAAIRLLELPEKGVAIPIAEINVGLAEHVRLWLDGGHTIATPFRRHPEAKLLMPELSRIGHNFDPDLLLFLDDFTHVTEAAQTLKLNALGKLTASIAHEIRNPLTAISHASQLMRNSQDDLAEYETLRDIVINNTQRVNEIIENILRFSRREDARQQQLDLIEWLTLFVPEYEQGQINGQCVVMQHGEAAVNIYFDPNNLRRIMTNLLDNGIRHASEQTGKPQVMIEVSKDAQNERAYIDVIDDGDGVPEEMQERLFEPFFTTSAQGSGLGLYLCRELCESNNSTLSYSRRTDSTTQFRVSIPLQATKS